MSHDCTRALIDLDAVSSNFAAVCSKAKVPVMAVITAAASGHGRPEALEPARSAWENGRLVAAICAAPTILAMLGITDGKRATCYPGCEDQMGSAHMVCAPAVTDGKLITGTSAGCAVPFGLALIAALKGQAAAQAVAEQIVIR